MKQEAEGKRGHEDTLKLQKIGLDMPLPSSQSSPIIIPKKAHPNHPQHPPLAFQKR